VTNSQSILWIFALGSAVSTIVADQRGRFRLVYVFKPLTILLIAFIAGLSASDSAPPYKLLILAGLGFSLIGDVFLMLRNKRFVEGLTCFLTAHLFYIAAFRAGLVLAWNSLALFSFIVYAMIIIRFLFPRLGRLKFPVIAYLFVLTAMAGLAAERFIQIGNARALCAFVGGALFVVSDSALAINRFLKEFKLAQPLILGTYFAAQALIALSV
jgi:uncharacterized membrane protein YhhN